jgi:hypothetical protein
VRPRAIANGSQRVTVITPPAIGRFQAPNPKKKREQANKHSASCLCSLDSGAQRVVGR